MHGIGELFGSAFDDVLRRPTPALVPALADWGVLLAGALVTSAAIAAPVFTGVPQGLPEMAFTVPEPLPSVTDLRDPTGPLLGSGPRAWLAVAAVVAVGVPLMAYARAGFLGVVLAAYFTPRDDPLAPRADSLDALREAFADSARRHFGPLLLLGLLEAAVGLAAVLLPQAFPYFRNSFLGLVAFDFLFIYAPYVVVVENAGALAALRRSVRTVSDYLASSLVALLFGLLTTGGVAALLRPIVGVFGNPGLLVGALVYAPIGTVLSVFYLKVYLSLRPSDKYAVKAGEVATKVAAPSEA